MAALVLQKTAPLQAAPAARRPEPIRLTFAKPPAPTAAPDEPRMFTELPADRADQRPENPAFLSNVTSRARDRVPGGATDLPRMEGEADAPQVEVRAATRPPAAPPAPDPADAPAPEPGEPAPSGAAGSGTILRRPGGAPPARPANDEAARGAAGNATLDQPEMANPGGNAALLGDVSLNTIAWDYAPWLQRYGARLRENWYPPTAYLYGILKEGGWGVFEVEIARSGQVLRIDLLEDQGHPSLVHAAQSALRTTAPTERLPADFPEPTLILRIRMIYPKIRSR